MFVVNVDWFFISHRLTLALAAQSRGYEVHIAAGLTNRSAELQSYGFTVHALPLDRSGTGVISAWRLAAQLWRIFRLVRPDLVHLITIKPVLLGGLAARMAGIRVMVAAVSGLGYVFVARDGWAQLRRIVIAAVYRLVFKRTNATVIVQNPDDRQQLMAITGLSADNFIMIRGSGVDLTRYVPQPQADGAAVVVLAARFLADKGLREFVQAAAILKARGCAARFVLVGSVDPANPASLTQAEIDAWVHDGVVENWGHRMDMPQVFAQARLVVLPSYREGMPKVLLEAAACGRPVITTDVAGCRDAIDAGVTGLLVPARDAPALANAIGELLSNPLRGKRMGDAGRSLAEREFDVRNVEIAHMQLYERLLAPDSPSNKAH